MIFDIICFDCDSTLSKIEGIDELAGRIGLGEQMAALTNAAMNGEIALEKVYERRLSLIKPDKKAIDWLADLYIETMVGGVEEVFKTLLDQQRQLHIVSGGIRQAILPLANRLGLSDNHVHAVDVIFDHHGNYQGFDIHSPLARTGGKAEICKKLKNGVSKLAMIGDGQTDLESKQAGCFFVGFGGVAEREAVRQNADCYVNDKSLTSILKFVC